MSPAQTIRIDEEHEATRNLMRKKQVIRIADIADTSRHVQFTVADEMFAKCDQPAREFLLEAAHPHVRAVARISSARQIKAMSFLIVRTCLISNIDHPEWGTFGVSEDAGTYYEIIGDSGRRILHKSEAVKFWRLA
jgi:hypothetical protein